MKYATQYDSEKMARAQGVGMPISLKQSVEICNHIKNRKYETAVRILEQASEMKLPIPYKKFNRGGTGHRKKTGPGRYPVKASGYILKLLKSAHANAGQKGLDVSNLMVNAVAKQGPRTPRYGRKRGRTAKRTHVEILVTQVAGKAKKGAKQETKAAPEAKQQKSSSGAKAERKENSSKAQSQAETKKDGKK